MAIYKNGRKIDPITNTSKIGCLLLSLFFIAFAIAMIVVFISEFKKFDFTSIIMIIMIFVLLINGLAYFKEFLDRCKK